MVALGGHAWLLQGGACMVAPGVCMVARGACVVAPGGGMHGCLGGGVVAPGGACVVARGGMRGIRRNTEIWSMSGQYASYWNAFLFDLI